MTNQTTNVQQEINALTDRFVLEARQVFLRALTKDIEEHLGQKLGESEVNIHPVRKESPVRKETSSPVRKRKRRRGTATAQCKDEILAYLRDKNGEEVGGNEISHNLDYNKSVILVALRQLVEERKIRRRQLNKRRIMFRSARNGKK